MRVLLRLAIVLALTLFAGWLALTEGVRLYHTMAADGGPTGSPVARGGMPRGGPPGGGPGGPGGPPGDMGGGPSDTGTNSSYRAPEAEVATSRVTSVSPVIDAYGRIASRSQLTVRVPEAGIVARVSDSLADGAPVTAGDFLFQLDDTSARADLEIARADLKRAELSLRDTRRQADVLDADLILQRQTRDIYEQELERVATLLERGSGLQSDYDSAQLSLISAKQTIASSEADLADLRADEDSLQLDIEDAQRVVTTAERTLADLTVTAGISGTYSGELPVVGESFSSGDEPAIITDLADLQAQLDLSQLEIGRITGPDGKVLPLSVSLRTPGSDHEYAATLSHVALSESDDTVMTRQVIAVLDPASCPCPLPGEFVAATIREPALDNVVVLPATAVSYDAKVLAVGEDNVLEDRQMTLLRRIGDTVAVAAPQESFDYVVERTAQLGAGLTISPVREDDAATNPEAEEPETPPQPPQGQAPSGGAPAREDPARGTPDMAPAAGEAGLRGPTVALEPNRRAALIAAIQARDDMPGTARAQLLQQLQADEVPVRLVERIEARE